MTNENNSDAPSSDPQRQPLEGPLPDDGKRKADATKNEADELAREFRVAEKWVIGTNIALAIIGIFALCIYYGQLQVMKGQLGEIIRQFPELQRTATANVKAADQTEKAVANADENFRLDERAWVGLLWINPTAVRLRNWGKGPAINITDQMLDHASKHKIDAKKYIEKYGFPASSTLHAGILFPGQEVDARGPEVELAKMLMNPEVANGTYTVYAMGEVTYYTFNVKHTTHVCGVWVPALKAFDPGYGCTTYNDAD